MKRFIVTGTPRSATQYTAALMQALGISCPHEATFRPTSSLVDVAKWSRSIGGESSWLAWAFLPLLPRNTIVLHQRRDPWKVIDSLAHRNWQVVRNPEARTPHQQDFHDVVGHYCPRLWEYESAIDRAAVLLIDWNRRIETMADDFQSFDYRIEDLDSERLGNILFWLQFPHTIRDVDVALESVSTEKNKGRKITKAPVSDPIVADYIKQKYGGCPDAISVEPATESLSPADLAERMDPSLCEEVNAYAVLHGYEPVAALSTAHR